VIILQKNREFDEGFMNTLMRDGRILEGGWGDKVFEVAWDTSRVHTYGRRILGR